MALLSRDDIIKGMMSLAEKAQAENIALEIVVVGGAAMALAYQSRLATRDVDAVFLSPPRFESQIRRWATLIAAEHQWPDDWLNDAAKGYMVGISLDKTLFQQPGLRVYVPSVYQLLAMKLSAWRDDVDIADAQRLLEEMRPEESLDAIWEKVKPYLVPGSELKAQYALRDLWEMMHGDS